MVPVGIEWNPWGYILGEYRGKGYRGDTEASTSVLNDQGKHNFSKLSDLRVFEVWALAVSIRCIATPGILLTLVQ